MASSKALIALDLQQTRLGDAPGDPDFTRPHNASPPVARIFLRNHSAKRERTYTKVAVSFKRGAARALQADAKLRQIYNIATINEAVRDGQDMNVYDQKTQPVMFAPKFNGVMYPIPPAADSASEPPLVQVPEGLWDLLMGNWDRMHSPDERVRTEESMRLALMRSGKKNPILFVTVDGERTMLDNPFGFIEIERRTEKMDPIAPTTDFLTALDLVE